MTGEEEQTIDRDLLLTREEVSDLLGADQATLEDWLERDWLRWIGALPSDPPARTATTAVLEVRDSWLREQISERVMSGRALVVDGLPETERAELLRGIAMARTPKDDLHRSLVNRQKRMKDPDAGPTRRRLPRSTVDLREQSLGLGTTPEPAEVCEDGDASGAAVAAAVIAEQHTNTVLVADLLGGVADAVIEVHQELLAVRSAIESQRPAVATSGDELPRELGQQITELLDLLREPATAVRDDEALPLAQFQLIVQALQGIRSELTQEDEHRDQLITGFGELVDHVVALRETIHGQPAPMPAPATESAAPRLAELTDILRSVQAEIAAVGNANNALAASLHTIRDGLVTAVAAPAQPAVAEPRLEKMEDALHRLVEDSERGRIGKEEVAAAVVRLAEDLATVRAGIERSQATDKAVADKLDRLLSEQRDDRDRHLAAELRANNASSAGLPWLVVAIAVLALSWSVVLFVKTGESKVPLTGMAAANLVCCIAVLMGTSRRSRKAGNQSG